MHADATERARPGAGRPRSLARWLLPLLLALALAVRAADDPLERTRPANDNDEPPDAAPPDATWQRGAFDPETGTLIWFEDVYN